MAIAALVVIGLGVLMILAGLWVSLSDRSRKLRAEAAKREVETEALGLAEDLSALQKLADALKGQPLGFQLIVLGIAVLVVGGLLGGISGL
ncbi:MAG TPA: hypothetical protein VFJ91_12655 [Gaiellaceae bacterium]|nr:hypothetical protein [Gaiellaceae bacterium]